MPGRPTSSETTVAKRINRRARSLGGGGHITVTWTPELYGGRPGVQWQASVALFAPRTRGRYFTAWSVSPLDALNLLDRITADEARARGVEPVEEVPS